MTRHEVASLLASELISPSLWKNAPKTREVTCLEFKKTTEKKKKKRQLFVEVLPKAKMFFSLSMICWYIFATRWPDFWPKWQYDLICTNCTDAFWCHSYPVTVWKNKSGRLSLGLLWLTFIKRQQCVNLTPPRWPALTKLIYGLKDYFISTIQHYPHHYD